MSAMANSWRPCLRALLALIGCGVCSSLGAQPRFVYRFDYRPPEEVFLSGFTALGGNRDLLEHVVVGRDSAFISTTESYAVARRFAQRQLRGASERSGYIYAISTNPTFYPVTASLEEFLARGRVDGVDREHYRLARAVESAIDEFGWEREYVTTGPVWARWVHSATPVDVMRRPGGRIDVQEGALVLNSAWHAPGGHHASLHPYPMHWPLTSRAVPVCAATIYELEDSEDSEELQGEDCEDDLWAAVDGDEYIHPALLVQCDALHRKKRSGSEMACGDGMPLINLSKRRRAQTAALTFSSGEKWSGWANDEL